MNKYELKQIIQEVLDEEGWKLSDEHIDMAKFLLFLDEYSAICERYGIMINTDILLKNIEGHPPVLIFNKRHIKEFVKEMKFLVHGQDI